MKDVRNFWMTTKEYIKIIETYLSKTPGSKEAILCKIKFDSYIDNLSKDELRDFNIIYEKK